MERDSWTGANSCMRGSPALFWLLLIAGCQPTPEPVTPSGMVLIPAGKFMMGSEDGFSDERPVREVTMKAFFMDATEVTNAQFAAFIEATDYVTVAERPLDPKDFPGIPKEKLIPGAAVFIEGTGWDYVPGASWKHPEGPKSGIKGKEDHPVVQVSWEDAVAYAKWAGKRLPTEAEWEYADRAGRTALKYSWGNSEFSGESPQANIWQGNFPGNNEKLDGYAGTAPVKRFAPNPWGLYEMGGNVWEWCADWYRPDAYTTATNDKPQGPESSEDPNEPGVPKRVMRGGSFLCAESSCVGYRPSARMKSSPDTGLMHVGFRCVKDIP